MVSYHRQQLCFLFAVPRSDRTARRGACCLEVSSEWWQSSETKKEAHCQTSGKENYKGKSCKAQVRYKIKRTHLECASFLVPCWLTERQSLVPGRSSWDS